MRYTTEEVKIDRQHPMITDRSVWKIWDGTHNEYRPGCYTNEKIAKAICEGKNFKEGGSQ